MHALTTSFPLQFLCLHDSGDGNAASAFGPATPSSRHRPHARGLTGDGRLFEEMTRAECEHLRELESCVECGQIMNILRIIGLCLGGDIRDTWRGVVGTRREEERRTYRRTLSTSSGLTATTFCPLYFLVSVKDDTESLLSVARSS